MATTNEHGERVTVIGSRSDGRGGRIALSIVEFVCCERPCFSVKGAGGFQDVRRFSTALRKVKAMFAHPSNEAEWLV